MTNRSGWIYVEKFTTYLYFISKNLIKYYNLNKVTNY
jgi:hypothetical protein